jgi:predicted nuclease of restriction endonuclease-like RecB superfamily
MVFPDFALSWGTACVFVDIVPFATPDYMQRKAEAVASLGEPMLVCVEERFASSLSEQWLLTYRRQLDPWELFAAARALVDGPLAAGD